MILLFIFFCFFILFHLSDAVNNHLLDFGHLSQSFLDHAYLVTLAFECLAPHTVDVFAEMISGNIEQWHQHDALLLAASQTAFHTSQ